MRSASLLGVMAVLVIVGLLVKRQWTAVRRVMPPAPITGTAPHQPPTAKPVQDAVDDLVRQHEAGLRRPEE